MNDRIVGLESWWLGCGLLLGDVGVGNFQSQRDMVTPANVSVLTDINLVVSGDTDNGVADNWSLF